MSLLSFPNEILLLVAEYLSTQDLNSFLQTNHHLAWLLKSLLHDHAVQDKDGLAALSFAAAKGYEKLARIVLEKGVDINYRNDGADKEQKTALHFAAEAGNEEMVRLLLEHGADISIRSEHGATALHWATKVSDSEAIMRLLLGSGADIAAEDDRGRTPLHWAIYNNGSKAVFKLFFKHARDLSFEQLMVGYEHARMKFGCE